MLRMCEKVNRPHNTKQNKTKIASTQHANEEEEKSAVEIVATKANTAAIAGCRHRLATSSQEERYRK